MKKSAAGFILLILVLCGAMLKWQPNVSTKQKDLRLKIAMSFFSSAKALDTAKISDVYEYELLENLFGTLVEFNSDGQFVAGVANSFVVKDGEVAFTFDKKVQTIDGHYIDAKDAELSLKRLVVFGKSGHGDIRNLLCPGEVLKSIKDSCPGIRVEGNTLFLKPAKPHFISLLIPTLESADYGIIPKSSINLDSPKLEIKDLRNTSGAYYLKEDSETGALVFQANPNHYHYSKNMPQTVEFVPTDVMQGPAALESGSVDLIPTSEFFSGDQAKAVLENTAKFNVHATLPIRVSQLCFSRHAEANFTVEQRLYAAQVIAEARRANNPTLGAQKTDQFFQALSDGTLTPTQLEDIRTKKTSVGRPKFKTPITFGVSKYLAETYAKALKDYPEIKLKVLDRQAYELPPEQRPDIFGIVTDSAWAETVALLGHNFEIDIFRLSGTSKEAWFTEYLALPSKEDRIKKLNALHYVLLSQAIIYPYDVYPYFAVTNKSWKLNLSKLSSDTSLWQIQAN